jgi:hypothetical protein
MFSQYDGEALHNGVANGQAYAEFEQESVHLTS